MTVAISSRADHDERHYRFVRVRADRLYIPLQQSPPVFGAWKDWAAGVATCAFMVVSYYTPAIVEALVN